MNAPATRRASGAGDRRGAASRAVELVQQLAQDEPGVADAAERDVVAAGEVARVVHDLAERGRRRAAA